MRFYGYMSEYVPLGIEKGYFSNENILDVLERLTIGINRFGIENRRGIFGSWLNPGILNVKPSLVPQRGRHIVFHELTHCTINNFDTAKEHGSFKVNLAKNKELVYRPFKFFNEVVAEFVACELSGEYRTHRLPVGHNLSSDWYSEYNMTYQQLGDEFLQTLSFINTEENDTDRKRFRELAKIAINPQKRKEMANMVEMEYSKINPKTGLIELTEISRSLLDMMSNKTYVTDEEEKDIRGKLAPYMPETWRPDEYLDENVGTPSIRIRPQSSPDEPRQTIKIKPSTQPKHIKITPSNISDVSRQITQYNPGKLSSLINAVKSSFSRLADKFKDR